MNEEVWLFRAEGYHVMAFTSEELLNAYVDKYHPNFDEKDYAAIAVRLVRHIDDV